MQFRFILQYQLSTTEIRPTAASELTLKRIMNDYGAWYYERSITDITVSRKGDPEGYAAIMAVDQSTACESATIKLQSRGTGGDWTNQYTGEFTQRDLEIDLDNCWVKVKPQEVSVYRCIDKNATKEVNILNAVTDVVESVIADGIAALGSSYPVRFYIREGEAPVEPTGLPITTAVYIGVTKPQPGSGDPWYISQQIYAITDCLGGVAQEPDDQYSWYNRTWQLTGNDCDENGTTEWWMIDPPLIINPSDIDVVAGHVAGAAQQFTAGDVPGDLSVPTEPYSIVWNTADIEIPNGRPLSSVIETLAALSCDSVTSLDSTFFLDDGIPINNNLTLWKDPHIHQITDVKYPNANNPATRALVTFAQIMGDLNKMFDVWWRVEGAAIVVEHRTFFTQSTDSRFINIRGFNKWSYDKSRAAGVQKYSTPAQMDLDFVGRNIEYAQPCATSDTDEINTDLLCADVTFIRQFEDDTPNDKLVILAVENGIVHNLPGVLSGSPKVNQPMAWSTLHRYFHRHHGNAVTGTINGEDIIDAGAAILLSVPIKEVKISTKDCQLNIDPYNVFPLPVGNGQIEEMKINLRTSATDITFKVW